MERTLLPSPLTSFIGRTREIQEITAHLEHARLVTLLGAGGSGKTRLAIAIPPALENAFDEIWFVELAPLNDSVLVAQTAANLIGVREAPNRSLNDALIQHFRGLNALLILDNCEHVIAACAQLAHALLVACPGLRILATSREPLQIEGEQRYLVPLLSMPHRDGTFAVQDVGHYEAIRLFVERARAVNSNFELSAHNAEAITRLCRRLDGIPLAIELAAARTKILSPDQIAARLDDRFLLLKADSRTTLPRHQTLRAAIDWSYDLLDDAERKLLNRIAVFAGGFELDAVEGITGDPFALDTLIRLADKSLIVVEMRDGPTARYHLLETIRQYALEKLRASGQEERTRDAHAQFYAERIRQADAEFFGPRQIALLEWMDEEFDNARGALDWLTQRAAAGDAGATLLGLQAAAGMWWHWDLHGYVREGRARLESLIRLAEKLPPSPDRAYGYIMLGHMALLQGDRETALAAPQWALKMGQEIGDGRTIMTAVQTIAIQLARMPNPEEALGINEQALELGRRFQDRHVMYTMLLDRAEITHMQGDEPSTEAAFREALELIQAQGDQWNLAAVRYSIGVHCWNHDDLPGARDSFKESLNVQVKMKDVRGMAYSFDGLAWVAAGAGESARSARLFGAADALFERMGARLFPRRQHLHDRALQLTRSALGGVIYEAEFANGRALPLNAAIQEALSVGVRGTGENAAGENATPGSAPIKLIEPLSNREIQVLRLLAADLSNREIADQLVVSVNTIKTQIKSIYGKLDAHSREDAVLKARALKIL